MVITHAFGHLFGRLFDPSNHANDPEGYAEKVVDKIRKREGLRELLRGPYPK